MNLAPEKKIDSIYSVGTLVYTLPRLLMVIFFLLVARLALQIVSNTVIPQLRPVLLDKVGASASQIALVAGTIPCVFSLILCPLYSIISDRTRSKWGRRTPFLFWSAPPMAIILVLVGFSSEISSFLVKIFPHSGINIPLWTLAAFIWAYQVIFLIPGSIFYYLEPDVVPLKCFGRYMAVSNIVILVATAAFNYYLLDATFAHPGLILTFLGVLYVVAYVLQLLFVKEGEYQPVEQDSRSEVSVFECIWEYLCMFFRQCFTRKVYIFLYLCMGLNSASTICHVTFNVLFATKELGISFATIGKVAAVSSVFSAILMYWIGKVMDKTSPMLVYAVGSILLMCVNVFGYLFVYSRPITCDGSITIPLLEYTFRYSWTYAEVAYTVVTIAITLIYAVQNLACFPLQVCIYPLEKLGQYGGADALAVNLMTVLGAALGGCLTQLVGYRVMFVWEFVVTGLGMLALWGVYREWKRYGGKDYKPPMVK